MAYGPYPGTKLDLRFWTSHVSISLGEMACAFNLSKKIAGRDCNLKFGNGNLRLIKLPGMTLADFQATLNNDAPPIDFDNVLQSLWYDAKGDWEMAHTIAQEIHTDSGSWVHAYLHRKEGDSGNAAYWYHMAHKEYPTAALEKEWEQLVTNFLNRHKISNHAIDL